MDVRVFIPRPVVQAAVFIYQLGESGFGPVRLRGLDSAKRYRVGEVNLPRGKKSSLAANDRVLTGDYLMTNGLAFPLVHAIESGVITITAEP